MTEKAKMFMVYSLESSMASMAEAITAAPMTKKSNLEKQQNS